MPKITKERKSWSSHGMSKTSFYNSWRGMKDRCLNPQSFAYSYYGGRGITVVSKWYSFCEFYSDMYVSYQAHCNKFGAKETTLDRIDPSKGYSKENCRWATRREQSQNQEGTVRESTIITWMQQTERNLTLLENTVKGLSQVLKEIVGKELMRGQALHKVLMDRGMFTDADLKKALEDIITEAKADLQKEAEAVKEAKDKAVELLVPVGANLKPPTEGPGLTPVPEVPSPSPEAVLQSASPVPEQPAPTQEAPSAEPTVSNKQV